MLSGHIIVPVRGSIIVSRHPPSVRIAVGWRWRWGHLSDSRDAWSRRNLTSGVEWRIDRVLLSDGCAADVHHVPGANGQADSDNTREKFIHRCTNSTMIQITKIAVTHQASVCARNHNLRIGTSCARAVLMKRPTRPAGMHSRTPLKYKALSAFLLIPARLWRMGPRGDGYPETAGKFQLELGTESKFDSENNGR